MYPLLKEYVLGVLLSLPITALALPEDNNKILHIAADSTEFNYKTGTDTYEGHVTMNQGTTHLKADRVVTQKNEHHKIISAIAFGLQQAAEYSTLPKQGDSPLHAKAKVIKYYPITSVVELEDNVTVSQGENSFQGPHIIYNMKEQTVSAPPSKNGRATIIIEPNQLKSKV